MKIVHFHFGKDGGAERFFVQLTNAFSRRGVEQKIIIRPNRAWKGDLDASVEVGESNFRTVSLDRFLLPLRVKSLIRQWRPDCVLGWMPRGAKLVPHIPGPLKLVRLGDYPTSLEKFSSIDSIVCNTPGIADHVRQMGWGKGLEVISNFTETGRATPIAREMLETPKDAFVVSSMGRFVPRKGFDVLIRAVSMHKNMILWLIGGGEEEKNLRALAEQLNVADRVRFAGWQKDPLPFVSASNCFAMASSHEPLGNVILEAWAQKVPVVSTRSEGPNWFMRHEENGLLVDIGDHQGFAAAFRRLEVESALTSSIVEGGTRTLAQQFSEDAVVGAYMRLISVRQSVGV